MHGFRLERQAVRGLILIAILLLPAGISCRKSVAPEPHDELVVQLDAVPLLLKADSTGTSTIWATVLQGGAPVPDSTMVYFAAGVGEVPPEAYTRDGLARVTYTPGRERGVAAIVAQVRAVRDTVLVTLY